MKLFIATLSLLFFTFTATAQENEVYEYLTMVKKGYELHVSIGSAGYEEIKIKDECDDKDYDLSAVNNRFSSFETEGWELVSAAPYSIANGNYPGFPMYQVVMRRQKE